MVTKLEELYFAFGEYVAGRHGGHASSVQPRQENVVSPSFGYQRFSHSATAARQRDWLHYRYVIGSFITLLPLATRNKKSLKWSHDYWPLAGTFCC